MEQNFKSLLSLVKEFIVNVWKVRKQKLYGNDSCPNQLVSVLTWESGGCHWALGLRGKGMVSSGKVSCIVFVMHVEYLLLRKLQVYLLLQPAPAL